ncbi:MAG: dienelactone hydrolase family protein [Ignavibacteriae bacterium]|nr:dienelactone hydrolase family protein [Ignavibacteriota bacterium]MCB9215162.1 dienelactone hydrolase family protein [Ignavibacteria bacterium]
MMNRHTRLFTFLLLGTIILIGCGSGAEKEEGEAENFTDTMAHEHAGDHPVGNDVAWMQPSVPVKGEDVSYASEVKGYLAIPEEGEKPTAGLIVIHEWWGLNDNVRAMTRRLAGEGYLALAVDLYDGNVASVPDSAKVYMGSVMQNPDAGVQNIGKAISYLKGKGATKIGVIGWCFGGGWSLQTAINYPDDIAAMIMYYGQLEMDLEKLKKLKMPILGIFGEKDQGIPVEQVDKFGAALNSLSANAAIQIYPNAGHAFANPSGERYNEGAARDAWERTSAFLKQNL